MSKLPIDVSVVIISYNTKALLLDSIQSVYETKNELNVEIFVVDNASSDDSVAAVKKEFPDVCVIENNTNKGFAAANNQAFRQMNGEFALLLNSDAFLQKNALSKMVSYMQHHPRAGIVCGQLLNTDGSKQTSVATPPSILGLLVNERLLRFFWPKKYPSKYRTYSEPVSMPSCIGACMLVREKAMDEVGLLDERYFFFMEETDWAKTFSLAGWNIVFLPDAYTIHAQGKSVGPSVLGRKYFYRSRYLYFEKWYGDKLPVYAMIVFVRLLCNFILTGLGVLVTFGQAKGLLHRCKVYKELIAWHLAGCPDLARKTGT